MADEPKHVDPFEPQDPTIPGVTGNAARIRPAPQPPAPLGQGYQQRAVAPSQNIFADPRVVIAIAVAAVLLLGFGFFWHSHSTSAEATRPAEIIAAAVSPPAAPRGAPAETSKPV